MSNEQKKVHWFIDNCSLFIDLLPLRDSAGLARSHTGLSPRQSVPQTSGSAGTVEVNYLIAVRN